MKSKIPTILLALLAAFTTLATIMNVVQDNADVIALAERTACQGMNPCRFANTSMMRTPLGQTFEYSDGKATVEIKCSRGAIAFGAYECRSSRSQAP